MTTAPSPTLFLAWQSPTARRFFTVGRLTRTSIGPFEFVYTSGFLKAAKAGMSALPGMTDTNRRYLSPSIFPLFENRLMNSTREEYRLHLERLGLATNEEDPLMILARSGGRRETDSYHVFPAPFERRTPAGERELCIQFFVNGFRYMPADSVGNAEKGPLFLMWDFQNPEDGSAVMIRSGDNHNLGWVPRYYNRILLRLRETGVPLGVRAEHVNPAGTPPWYRLLCSVTAPWPASFDPMTEDDECRTLA